MLGPVPPAVYVEIDIAADPPRVWELTQEPSLHQRWDLRFSEITYEGAPLDDGTQRFRYSRRIVPGFVVTGWGETVGESRREDGAAASALRFGSDQKRSLIHEGSGYWRYLPTDGGVRFLTRYDYEVRWGVLGRVLDRLFFRRAIGWATAYSFDTLRLWLEKHVEPVHPLRALTAGRSPQDLPRASRCLRRPRTP